MSSARQAQDFPDGVPERYDRASRCVVIKIAITGRRRGTAPMIRRQKHGQLEPVGWDEAMDFFIQKFREAWNQRHENLACYNSGQLTIEEFCGPDE